MDDLLERMQIYERALVAFNERLRDSMTDLETHHEAVAPYWDASSDNMRRQYDAQWEPLDALMKHYLRVEGPGYVEFLNIKLHALREYLYGGQ